ncbi:MAG: GxxExxY protein [Ferruginibacter sp.]
MPDIIFKEESFKIIGVCMDIHRSLGMGLKEVNYKDAMEMDFIEKQIPFEREKRFDVFYKEKRLLHPYYADFILYDAIILEVKSCTTLIDAHVAQALSYLAVANRKLALLINFGEKSLTYKRIVL